MYTIVTSAGTFSPGQELLIDKGNSLVLVSNNHMIRELMYDLRDKHGYSIGTGFWCATKGENRIYVASAMDLDPYRFAGLQLNSAQFHTTCYDSNLSYKSFYYICSRLRGEIK